MEDIQGLLKCIVNTDMTTEDKYLIDVYRSEGKEKELEDFYKSRFYFLDREMRIAALKEVLKSKYINYYRTLIDTENVEELLPTLKKIKELELSQDNVENSPYMFITLAPPKGEIDVHHFIKLALRFCNFKYIQKYVFVIEQRFNGIPNEMYSRIGDGMHMHILMDKSQHKISHIKRDFKRVFGCYTMNVKWEYRRKSDLFKTQNYITGDKADDDKKIKQKFDKEYRELLGIKGYYGELFED